jgi:superfamily II DNA/RNA helicase
MTTTPSAPAPETDAVSDAYATDATFESLGVSQLLCDALAADGITTAFPIQAMTIADALAGRDVCGKAKTGSGKTLGFGLPMLMRIAENLAGPSGAPEQLEGGPAAPRGLVLLPTRELAVQVHDVLSPLAEAIGLRVVAVYGGADIERQISKLRHGCELIIATPGRLIDLGDRGELRVDELDVLVLDEADRMADMGFMPQVEWVLRRLQGPHQTLLFSATLDGAVDRLVSRYLTDPVFHEVQSDTQTVDRMVQHFFNVHQMDKVKVAAAIVTAYDKALIFCRTKRGADRVVEELEKVGVHAGAIHGDLRQQQREKALADFTSGKLHVLVATDVAARGLHIDAVDVVVHYDPAEDEKAYLHRSGRTARAGTDGIVVSLLLWNQMVEAEVIQRRLALRIPIIEVFSNNPCLKDLANFQPDPADSVL